MNCTVRRRFKARTAREGAIRIAGAIDIAGSLSGVRCAVDYGQSNVNVCSFKATRMVLCGRRVPDSSWKQVIRADEQRGGRAHHEWERVRIMRSRAVAWRNGSRGGSSMWGSAGAPRYRDRHLLRCTSARIHHRCLYVTISNWN